LIKPHHLHQADDANPMMRHPHAHHRGPKEGVSWFMEESHHRHGLSIGETQPFHIRFERAMRSLSPWESRAVTFVLGLGLGSLLRMFIVLAIVLIRGRRAGRRCAMRRGCGRRAAQRDAEVVPTEPSPPAYSDNVVDEKPKIVEIATAPEVEQVKEVVTVQFNEAGTLEVIWQSTNGEQHVTPAPDFHQFHHQELINFYESNLKWKPVEDLETETK